MRRRNGRAVRQQREDRRGDDRIAVRQVRELEPRAPAVRSRQVLAEVIDERAVPHQFVVLVGCSERHGNGRHDHEHCKPAARRIGACVLAETDVGNDRHERGADEVTRAPDREHVEGIGQQLDAAADDPETDDDEQHADRPAAHFALGRDEAQPQQQVASGREDQQCGECYVEIHRYPFDLTKSADNVTCAKRLIPGTTSQLLQQLRHLCGGIFTIFALRHRQGLSNLLISLSKRRRPMRPSAARKRDAVRSTCSDLRR